MHFDKKQSLTLNMNFKVIVQNKIPITPIKFNRASKAEMQLVKLEIQNQGYRIVNLIPTHYAYMQR